VSFVGHQAGNQGLVKARGAGGPKAAQRPSGRPLRYQHAAPAAPESTCTPCRGARGRVLRNPRAHSVVPNKRRFRSGLAYWAPGSGGLPIGAGRSQRKQEIKIPPHASPHPSRGRGAVSLPPRVRSWWSPRVTAMLDSSCGAPSLSPACCLHLPNGPAVRFLHPALHATGRARRGGRFPPYAFAGNLRRPPVRWL
jgi:hypothetical protein